MLPRKLFLLLIFIFPLTGFSIHNSPDSGFILETVSLQPYTPAYIGNGHFSLVSTLLGITDAESFMGWVYDHGPEDVPRIAVLPAWNGIDIQNGQTWLSKITPGSNTVRSYNQRINMYDGTLETKYQWVDGERITEVEVVCFPSRANPNLAALKLTLTPHYTGSLRLSFSLRDWPDPKRLPLETLEKLEPDVAGKMPNVWYPGNMVIKDRSATATARGARASIVSVAEGRETNVAQVMEARWPSDLKALTTRPESEGDSASIEIQFQAEKKPYTFYKYVGIASSHDASDPLKAATQAVDSTKARSYDLIFTEHARAWHELWNTDIQVEGDPEFQKVVHSMIFYLLCSVAKDTDFSIPPMGLSSDGYYGHIFWDADTWMFPALVMMHPELAESIVMFRYRTLDAAQHKAKELGFRGAMYPWEADEIGNETTPQFAYQNAFYEIHVTGDVAFAQWQYYLATGDKKWLKEFGYPVIQQTADFWTSRVTFNQQQNRYEIQNVVSVDEGLIGIHNDAYTNAVAKKNLEVAISASRALGVEENPEWKKIAAGLFMPYNEIQAFHPPYENAPATTLGSVVPLLSYPLQISMSERAKQNNLSHAVKQMEEKGSGAMMTITLLPVVAAELGDRNLLNQLWEKTYQPYLRPPFNVLAETPTTNGTNFVTGAGGFLQQVIFGYTGLRLTEDGLAKKFSPLLPSSIKKLKLVNFKVRSKRFDFEAQQ